MMADLPVSVPSTKSSSPSLNSAHNLAITLRKLGDVQAARDLDQDTVDRLRRVMGHDHHLTLRSAAILAADLRELGDLEAARDLEQDTLDRRRRALGPDHPDTLTSATTLAADLRELGDLEAARDLEQDALEGRRRVLGEDHPDTLASASNLAADLRQLGEAPKLGPQRRDCADRISARRRSCPIVTGSPQTSRGFNGAGACASSAAARRTPR